MYVSVYVRIQFDMYLYVHIYVSFFAYMYIYVYIQVSGYRNFYIDVILPPSIYLYVERGSFVGGAGGSIKEETFVGDSRDFKRGPWAEALEARL